MISKEKTRLLIAAGIGAVSGGIVIAAVTNAIPRLMEEMSNTMMGKMMKRMEEEGCTPAEM